MGAGETGKMEMEHNAVFPGNTHTVPKDLITTLQNMSLEITTIVVGSYSIFSFLA